MYHKNNKGKYHGYRVEQPRKEELHNEGNHNRVEHHHNGVNHNHVGKHKR